MMRVDVVGPDDGGLLRFLLVRHFTRPAVQLARTAPWKSFRAQRETCCSLNRCHKSRFPGQKRNDLGMTGWWRSFLRRRLFVIAQVDVFHRIDQRLLRRAELAPELEHRA